MSADVVSEGEGNEAGREGQQGVGAARSSEEAGEPTRRDPVEGRGCRAAESSKGKTKGISSPVGVSTKLRRIAELARRAPSMVLTSLSHHFDVEFLKVAYERTRKNAAPGVDGQTAEDYRRHLEENLQGLLDRLKSGTYRAPNVRRVQPSHGSQLATQDLVAEDSRALRVLRNHRELAVAQELLPASDANLAEVA